MTDTMSTAVAQPDSETRTPFISVVLADDHPLIISGMRRTIEHAEDIDVVGEARTGPQLFDLVERRSPDVVLMDLQMPGTNGFDLIEQIRDSYPDVKVVILSASDERSVIDAALHAGAKAYVIKSAMPSDIAAVLRQVASGAVFLAPPTRPESRPRPNQPRRPDLTEREHAVLEAVVAGMTTAQISRQLWISEHTIKFHLTNIYRKLGVTNRAGAVRHALELGIGVGRSGPHDSQGLV
jgi:DNA-binding NarL/FixJ family response regulator